MKPNPTDAQGDNCPAEDKWCRIHMELYPCSQHKGDAQVEDELRARVSTLLDYYAINIGATDWQLQKEKHLDCIMEHFQAELTKQQDIMLNGLEACVENEIKRDRNSTTAYVEHFISSKRTAPTEEDKKGQNDE